MSSFLKRGIIDPVRLCNRFASDFAPDDIESACKSRLAADGFGERKVGQSVSM